MSGVSEKEFPIQKRWIVKTAFVPMVSLLLFVGVAILIVLKNPQASDDALVISVLAAAATVSLAIIMAMLLWQVNGFHFAVKDDALVIN